jgi:hypothetical protein
MADQVVKFSAEQVGKRPHESVLTQTRKQVFTCVSVCANVDPIEHENARSGGQVIGYLPVQVLTEARDRVLKFFPSLAETVNQFSSGPECHHLTGGAGQIPDPVMYAVCRPLCGPLDTVLQACACYHASGICTGLSMLPGGVWQLSPRGYTL